MTGRCGLVASMLVAIVVMAASSAWAHERPFRIIVAFSASACPRGGSPLPQVEAESDLMLVKLRSVATNADVVGLPAGALGHRAPLRKKELLDAIKADRRPLWLTYSGHATVTKGQSSLCLGEATVLPVADVLDAINPAVPFATVLLNACSTAAVDPRRSNLVVISASPDEVTTTLSGSVLGERLLATLRGTYDTDGDGVFSSMELFEALRGVHIHEWPAQTRDPPAGLERASLVRLAALGRARSLWCPRPLAPARRAWSRARWHRRSIRRRSSGWLPWERPRPCSPGGRWRSPRQRPPSFGPRRWWGPRRGRSLPKATRSSCTILKRSEHSGCRARTFGSRMRTCCGAPSSRGSLTTAGPPVASCVL